MKKGKFWDFPFFLSSFSFPSSFSPLSSIVSLCELIIYKKNHKETSNLKKAQI